jgi:transposase
VGRLDANQHGAMPVAGHDARSMPAKYVRPYSKGRKNDLRDAEAIAETVQRPTMKFVATKTADQLDLQALHRVRERLVSQRTGIINQIRAFLLERGVAVRQGLRFLRAELPIILATRSYVLSPRMLRMIEELAGDWRRLDERIEGLSQEIEAFARQDPACERLMTVPGIGPIISSAMVAAIGNGAVFTKGRDFAAWLGLVPKQISTGDRTILGAISRLGNRYLRALFVDVTESRIAPAILESCLSQVFVPNARAVEPQGRAAYERLGLNARQIETVARATSERDCYFQSARGNRLFELGLPTRNISPTAWSRRSSPRSPASAGSSSSPAIRVSRTRARRST